MGFPTVYETTILSKHPVFVIFGPKTKFWAGQEVKGAGKKMLVLKHHPSVWILQYTA